MILPISLLLRNTTVEPPDAQHRLQDIQTQLQDLQQPKGPSAASPRDSPSASGVGYGQDLSQCKAISSSAHSFAKSAPNSSSEAVRGGKLQTAAESKRVEQSTSASESSFLQPLRSFDQKESARFGPELPVDAHLRFRRKSAPTPNDAQPRLHIRFVAAQRGYQQRVKVSTRLAAPFVR